MNKIYIVETFKQNKHKKVYLSDVSLSTKFFSWISVKIHELALYVSIYLPYMHRQVFEHIAHENAIEKESV